MRVTAGSAPDTSRRQNSKTVVVTGASSGIGRQTALLLARTGWDVFATVRKQSDAESVIRESAGRIRCVQLDVTDEESVLAAARQVGEMLGDRGLDGLVNNAGMGIMAPVEHVTADQLRLAYEVNVFGQIAVIQAFLPRLRRGPGRIVNVGSVGDHISPPFSAALASPKAAIASITGALRLELRPDGIAVCLVEPGSINTPAVDKTLGDIEGLIGAMPDEGALRYGRAMRRMGAVFAANERAGSSPDVVAGVIERALTDRHPKVRYPAGKDARKLSLLSRLLPEKVVDRAVLRQFGLTADSDQGHRNQPTDDATTAASDDSHSVNIG